MYAWRWWRCLSIWSYLLLEFLADEFSELEFLLKWSIFSCDNIDWLQLNQISSLTEKRPSITEKELTPIVLNQLQSTKKHKVRSN